MPIHAIAGDVVEVGPKIAEASVLWLRTGFNGRDVTWRFSVAQRYTTKLPPEHAIFAAKPWVASTDQLIEIAPADGQLKYVYVFSNPTDGIGVGDAAEVEVLVERSIIRLVSKGVCKIAMIHIPLAARQAASPDDTRTMDTESARAMITAIRMWESAHPIQSIDVFLVDKNNDFARLL